MTRDEAIALLTNDPRLLMRQAFLSIAGGNANPPANGQAQLASFRIEVLTAADTNAAQGFTTGIRGYFFRRTKVRPTVRITKQPNLVNPPTAGLVNAYYIPMVQVGDVAAGTSHYILPTVGATHLCITSRLTGCVFSVGSDAGGAVLASHVQPPAGPAATVALRQRQANAAGITGFAGAPAQARHGVNYDLQTNYVAVIGHRAGATWSFHMQRSGVVEGDVYNIEAIVDIA